MLQQQEAEITEERHARKQPFTDAELAELIGAVETVRIARGRKVVAHDPAEVAPDDLKGRSGSARAPIVRVGSELLVGFCPGDLERLITD